MKQTAHGKEQHEAKHNAKWTARKTVMFFDHTAKMGGW
jgi:hypothetical protein